MRPAGDAELVQIIDAALIDSTKRSSHWLACRPGCNQCCHGVFRMNMLDAERLRGGLRLLDLSDPDRASRVHKRVSLSVTRLTPGFPGDLSTGLLGQDDASLEAFEDFANEEVCPVLDPETGTCDLYQHRPLTCRTFGPPVITEEGIGICELCFVGAPEEAILAAEMHLPPPALEARLNDATGLKGETIVAFALRL